MKTTIEVGGYEIKIEEMEGNISVSAMKDGEVMEEFELESEGFESQDMGEEDDDMMSFGDEEMEDEGEFGGEEMEDDDDEEFEAGEEMEEEEEEEMEDETGKLESFSFFVKKRKK